ncbi:Mucin-associated surface protein (MASP), subgroup S051 [Trypanosoma cruzi]|nr:Mucin-associated surface protein (MASP), subgroup S051 [Trypanosoma cruzi]
MAMMITGRVLLVCALCVLWCGADGGECSEPTPVPPASPPVNDNVPKNDNNSTGGAGGGGQSGQLEALQAAGLSVQEEKKAETPLRTGTQLAPGTADAEKKGKEQTREVGDVGEKKDEEQEKKEEEEEEDGIEQVEEEEEEEDEEEVSEENDEGAGAEDGEKTRTEGQGDQEVTIALDQNSGEKNLSGSEQQTRQSIVSAGEIPPPGSRESSANPTQTKIEEKKETDKSAPAAENTLTTVNGENTVPAGVPGGNPSSPPEDGVDSREQDGEVTTSEGEKNVPPPATAATPQSHQEKGSEGTGEDTKATTVTANTTDTTNAQNSDGITAVPHTTSPLLLLLVVACTAAAVVAA